MVAKARASPTSVAAATRLEAALGPRLDLVRRAIGEPNPSWRAHASLALQLSVVALLVVGVLLLDAVRAVLPPVLARLLRLGSAQAQAPALSSPPAPPGGSGAGANPGGGPRSSRFVVDCRPKDPSQLVTQAKLNAFFAPKQPATAKAAGQAQRGAARGAGAGGGGAAKASSAAAELVARPSPDPSPLGSPLLKTPFARSPTWSPALDLFPPSLPASTAPAPLAPGQAKAHRRGGAADEGSGHETSDDDVNGSAAKASGGCGNGSAAKGGDGGVNGSAAKGGDGGVNGPAAAKSGTSNNALQPQSTSQSSVNAAPVDGLAPKKKSRARGNKRKGKKS